MGPTAEARQRTLRAMAEPGRTEEVLRIGAALHYFLWARCQRHAIEGVRPNGPARALTSSNAPDSSSGGRTRTLVRAASRSVPARSELAATVRFLVSADPASEVLVATSLGTFVITL